MEKLLQVKLTKRQNLAKLERICLLHSGLGYRAVAKQKQAWEKVPAKSVRLFEELQALMDPSRNMSKYRTLLNEASHLPPVIPYIPVVKKDLTFLHLGIDLLSVVTELYLSFSRANLCACMRRFSNCLLWQGMTRR